MLGKLGRAMRRIALAWWMVCLSGAVSVASAQTDVRRDDWHHGTTLKASAGVAMDSSQNGPVLGGAVGWEMTPRFGIEGSGAWAEFGHGTSSFAGAMTVRAGLTGRATVDPFVRGGVGMYRARFGPNEDAIPSFYQRRMANQTTSMEAGATFTDPTLVGGGGVNIRINRHLALRPDVEALLVFRSGHHHVVMNVAMQAVYHFERHPVTPAIRR
jgi:hypothetical protein